MKPVIETWDDPMKMVTHYHVAIPGTWFVRQKGRIGLTWLMVKLIWGIGASPTPEATDERR